MNPNIKGADIDKVEQDRKKFEGELSAYHAEHGAEAQRLAGFDFAASAAFVCEALSRFATQNGSKRVKPA